MAGTRLLVNLVAVGQLLVLLGSSLYFGLCHRRRDFICIPLFHQGGRTLLQHDVLDRLQELERLNNEDWSTIEPVVVGVADDRKVWEESIVLAQSSKKSPHDRIDIQLVDSLLLQSACYGAREWREKNKNPIHIWICPEREAEESISLQPPSTTWKFLQDGSIAVYPKSTVKPEQVWQTFYPDVSKAPRHHLRRLVLTVMWDPIHQQQHQQKQQENDDTVSLWLDRLQTWVPYGFLQASPLWDSNIETNFVVPDLSEKARRIQQEHFDSETNSTLTTVSYEIGIDDAARVLQETFRHDDNTKEAPWRITLWIPSHVEPMSLVDSAAGNSDSAKRSSHILQVTERHWFAPLSHHQHHDNAGKDVVNEILNRLLAQAMGIPEAVAESLFLAEMSWGNGTDTFYWNLWIQRRIRSLYHHALSELRSEYNRLSQSRWTVAITKDIAQILSDVASSMERAIRHGSKDWLATVECLETSLQQLQALQRNPDLAEPLDLSIDHYAGIFVPLLVPLLIPMLLGLIRETRRYRDKTTKPGQSTEKQKED